jgi:hypothetical protein
MTYPKDNDPDPNTIKDDPRGPNKFTPEHHEAFPGQPTGHSEPGDNKK